MASCAGDGSQMRWWMREKDGLVSGGWWVRVRGEYVDYIDWNKHMCVD